MAKTACPYCGYLDWTVEMYGRVTHKQDCPMRRDLWHQGNPTIDIVLRDRAEELKSLPEGWDSYNGERIDPATADRAVELALAVAPLFPSYQPQLVPSSDGTVQVEWHADGWNVEMWVQRVTS